MEKDVCIKLRLNTKTEQPLEDFLKKDAFQQTIIKNLISVEMLKPITLDNAEVESIETGEAKHIILNLTIK